MLDKKTKSIITILKNEYPLLRIYKDGEEFGDDEYSPPEDLSWEELVIMLRKKGLEITFIRE